MKKSLALLLLAALWAAPLAAQGPPPIEPDDGTVAGARVIPVTLNLSYLWNGANWIRAIGDATNGAKVNCTAGCNTAGTLTNNNAAPSNTNGGALTAIASAAAQSYTEGRLVLPRVDLFGSTAVRILKSDGTDVTYLASVTEGATETAGTSLQATSSYLKAYDGATFARLRSRAAIIGSADIGLVVRPFMGSDGTNTMPTMDGVLRPGYVTPTARQAAGTFTGDITCETSKIYDNNTSGNTELVPISGTKNIYVCGYELMASGTVNVSLVTGIGAACATAASGTPSTGTSGASAALTPAWQLTTQTGKLSAYPTHGWLLSTGAANALCVKTTGAVSVQLQVFYHQE